MEIGALNAPLPLPAGVTVLYVDRASAEDVRKHYVELKDQHIVDVDIIDDAETLATISDSSLDFVIANHVVEHLQNPIKALENFIRVLRPGGIAFIAMPDKRYTFDRKRAVTPMMEIVRDYKEGAAWSMEEHYRDWCENVEGLSGVRLDESVREKMAKVEEIHFHTWTKNSFRQLLDYCRETLRFPIQVETIKPNSLEFVVILRKTA